MLIDLLLKSSKAVLQCFETRYVFFSCLHFNLGVSVPRPTALGPYLWPSILGPQNFARTNS